MSPIPYKSLDKKQLAQVAYLFADNLFGTEASAYMYDLNADGNVAARSSINNQPVGKQSTARVKEYRVQMTRDAQITKAQIDNAMMHMNALAAIIAEKSIPLLSEYALYRAYFFYLTDSVKPSEHYQQNNRSSCTRVLSLGSVDAAEIHNLKGGDQFE